jgi:hypothetical protein
MIGESKLQSLFPNLHTFLSTFTVYASLRIAFEKDYRPAFMVWMEQISYHATYAPWPNVLKYAVNYFRTHQRDPPVTWLQFDNHLTAVHFTHANLSQSTSNPTNPPSKQDHNPHTETKTTNPQTRIRSTIATTPEATDKPVAPIQKTPLHAISKPA